MDHLQTVIRIDPAYIEDMPEDLIRFRRAGMDVEYQVPMVKTLSLNAKGKGVSLVDKPLLLSYGFLSVPLHLARNPVRLSQIVHMSRFVRGFMYRKEADLEEEALHREEEGLGDFKPVLVETVEMSEVNKLFEVAEHLGVKNHNQDVALFSIVVLRGYPFDGLSARVIKKKANRKIQVEILSSNVIAWVDIDNLFYNETLWEDPS